MAVKPTPNNSLYKGFTFDGIDSRDYGVYISGDAVFDSPERDVEMIEIPGRNGSFALDKGRFGNITVSYPAGLFGEDEASFREGIRALRNALASRKGYCRLEDDYNPNEYRMAVYKKGLEVDPALLKAGEFTIEFDCMPQRWLKSGETAVSVASSGTITNPTLFESHPLLQVWGYGEVGINDESVEVMHVPVGTIQYANTESRGGNATSAVITKTFDTSALANTDEITVASVTARLSAQKQIGVGTSDITFTSGGDGEIVQNSPSTGDIAVRYTPPAFVKNTARTNTYMWRWAWTPTSPSAVSFTVSVTVTVAYTTAGRIEARMSVTSDARSVVRTTNITRGDITGYSTKSALGEPLYFDLDIGEAYKYEDDSIVSINNAVTIPAKLPVLKSGANTITYDDTVDQFRIVPRWWEV